MSPANELCAASRPSHRPLEQHKERLQPSVVDNVVVDQLWDKPIDVSARLTKTVQIMTSTNDSLSLRCVYLAMFEILTCSNKVFICKSWWDNSILLSFKSPHSSVITEPQRQNKLINGGNRWHCRVSVVNETQRNTPERASKLCATLSLHQRNTHSHTHIYIYINTHLWHRWFSSAPVQETECLSRCFLLHSVRSEHRSAQESSSLTKLGVWSLQRQT